MIIIGCPVYQRDWILPYWFEAIEKQTYPLSKLGFVFIAGADDEETLSSLFAWHRDHPEVGVFDVSVDTKNPHQEHTRGIRRWNKDRYLTMANLRNDLLDRVSCYEPDKFFSLDSDILLEDPETIEILDAATNVYDAASPLAFMSPRSLAHPNVMSWVNRQGMAARKEYPLGSSFKADVIMAAKMMSKKVYSQVRYEWHRQGEDLGWSRQCQQKGFNLYSVSSVYCPHIMSQAYLDDYLEAGDPRFKIISAATCKDVVRSH